MPVTLALLPPLKYIAIDVECYEVFCARVCLLPRRLFWLKSYLLPVPSAKMDGALGSPGVESQAEPLPSLKRPCSGMPAGTPWGKLQKTDVSFVHRQSQPSPVRAEGEWCNANDWERNQPLNMEPLTTPLPPMRPVRNISSIPGAAPDSSVPDTPLVTEAANDAA